jgi:anti-sigma factor RsiW
MSTPSTMLSCREVVELVSEYLDGNLGPEEHARVREHLDGCDGCEGFVEQVRATVRAVGQVQPDALDDQARERLLQAFREWKTSPGAPDTESGGLWERLRRLFR